MPTHHKTRLEYDSNSEENPFVDLSDEGLKGIIYEPGYYDFYADHDPSKSISLFDSKSKFSGDQYMQSENLCSVDSGQVKSAESHCSKLAAYEESKLVYT